MITPSLGELPRANAPDTASLLNAWDWARSQPTVERPAALLDALLPRTAERPWLHEPLGRRDQQLLGLHQHLFGDSLPCTANCPACATVVEFEMLASQLRLDAPPLLAPLRLEHGDAETEWRLPNTADLAAAAKEPDVTAARRCLLGRCLLTLNGQTARAQDLEALSEAFVQLVAARMAEADPQGDVAFQLRCPECHHPWEAPFEIASYLWTRLHAWASRLLREVHELARAYGWSEGEVLRLSPARRQAYLELVRA